MPRYINYRGLYRGRYRGMYRGLYRRYDTGGANGGSTGTASFFGLLKNKLADPGISPGSVAVPCSDKGVHVLIDMLFVGIVVIQGMYVGVVFDV